MNFSDFYFYALRRFLVNFQGYSVFCSKVIPNGMKRKCQKSHKSQNWPKESESDKCCRQQKRLTKLPVCLLKHFIISWSKSLQSFMPMALKALEIPKGVIFDPHPHIQCGRDRAIRNITKQKFRNSKCAFRNSEFAK